MKTQFSLVAAAFEVLKKDWFILVPAVIYSLGFSLISPHWVLKENLTLKEMYPLLAQLSLFLIVQLWVQLFTLRMILQVMRTAPGVKNIEMSLSDLTQGIFWDWLRLVFANVLLFSIALGGALFLPAKPIVFEVLRVLIFLLLFILFTLLPAIMMFNQFSLFASLKFLSRVLKKAWREFLYLISMVLVFKLMLFILAVQIAFIPGLGRPLGVSLMDAFSLVMTLIMMMIVIRPLSVLTARINRRA